MQIGTFHDTACPYAQFLPCMPLSEQALWKHHQSSLQHIHQIPHVLKKRGDLTGFTGFLFSCTCENSNCSVNICCPDFRQNLLSFQNFQSLRLATHLHGSADYSCCPFTCNLLWPCTGQGQNPCNAARSAQTLDRITGHHMYICRLYTTLSSMSQSHSSDFSATAHYNPRFDKQMCCYSGVCVRMCVCVRACVGFPADFLFFSLF